VWRENLAGLTRRRWLGFAAARVARSAGMVRAGAGCAGSCFEGRELVLRAARYAELGAGYYASRTDKDRKARNHIRQLEALGFTVTLAQAA